MTQIDAKLSIEPLFGRAIAAVKELAAAWDQLKKKEAAPSGGKGATTAVGVEAAKSAKQARELGQAVAKVHQDATQTPSGSPPFGAVRRGLKSVSEQLASARAQLLGFLGLQVGAQGVQQLASMADRYVGITARLRLATRGQEEFNQGLATARTLAARYNQPLAETAALYTRVLSAVRPLGGGLREAGVATEALLASLRISGATSAESASAVLQFSQALGAGALRGEEFNAIAEAAPRLLDALAAGMGKPRHELKALAEQGQLTSSAIVTALARELPRLRDEAARIPDTIGSAAQGVSSGMLRLVGATAEGSRGVQVIVNLLKLLAQNLELVLTMLTAVGVAIAALKLGVLAQGMVTAGAAAVTAAGGVAVFGAALKGALLFVTGPVGWLVALAAAAAAWLTLSRAKAKAGERTEQVVRQELADAQAELRAAKDYANKVNPFGLADARQREREAARQLKQLEDELELVRQRQAEEQELQRLQRRGSPITLQSPKTIADIEKEFETRFSVEKRFADKRAEYLLEKDRQIELARSLGVAPAELATLERDKVATLAEIDRDKREALRKFDERDQATKVAQAKAGFDRQLELALDAVAREKTINQEGYDDKLLDLKTYLAQRAQLEDQENALHQRKLEQQLRAEQDALALNQRRLAKAKPGNERETLQTAVDTGTAKVAELEVQIVKAQRDQNDQRRERGRLETQITNELRLQREQVLFQLEDATGQDLSREQLLARAQAANRQALEAFRSGGDGKGEQALLKLIDVQATQAELAQVERAISRVQQSLASREAQIQAQVSAGALTVADGERQVLELRQKEIPVLDAILARMEALATTPEDKQRLADLRVRLEGMRDLRTELEKTARSSAVDGLTTALNDIASGAKTTKEALLDMVGGFARAMMNVLNQRLAEALVDQFSKALVSSQGGGGFFAAAATFIKGLFFHSGGVVGQGGRAGTVPAAAFALAPRYHAGGIAGLKPRETPAILEIGEEVLTADDPRHVRNGGRGAARALIGNLNVSVQVEGTEPGAGNAALADGLARVIKSKVSEGIREEMRPGGLLAKG